MFYVQVARLEDPDGAGKEEYLLVGGSPTGRGVVTSASYSARSFGVRSGMPTAQALKLCPQARVAPVSRRTCSAKSREIREVLDELSPVVQAASIDEFYLDLSGTERLFHEEPLAETARRIREEVLKRTDISVSVGGGTRKLVAKLAAGRAKPGGVLVVPAGEESLFMRTFDLREIPGVGPALAEKLRTMGLVTVEDLLPVDRVWLDQWLGSSRALWLWERAQGVDSSRVDPDHERKSVSSERTFHADLDEDRALDLELLRLVGSVGRTLRRKGLKGRTITVKIRDGDFKTRQASHTLPDPVESDGTVLSVARSLFMELRNRRRTSVRLLGIGVSSLVEGDGPPQLELFQGGNSSESERDRVVSRVLDDIRGRFGDDVILPGSMLKDNRNRRPGQGDAGPD
jgi:DNA polymerase-4